MFKEILQIIPKLDAKDLAAMEKSLSSRFVKIAKGFGSGILSSLKGGGYVAVATALINKVLNPLEHVQSVIEKTLNEGSDLATFAKQFETSAGNLARLQALGKANGLDPEGVRTLLLKFQASVAQAALNPDKETSVSKFVGKKDTAEAFFEFIQSMQKLNPIQRNLVQQEVFGERQIGRASQFLNANFKELLPKLGGPSSENLSAAVNSLDAQKNFLDLQEAKRGLNELDQRAQKITPHSIRELSRRADFESGADTKSLSNFDRLERLQIAGERIAKQMEDGFAKIAPLIAPALEALPGILNKLNIGAEAVSKSRALRGLIPGQGKDK
jgi:hypothetical protein